MFKKEGYVIRVGEYVCVSGGVGMDRLCINRMERVGESTDQH